MADTPSDLDALVAALWPQAGGIDPQRMAELVGEVRSIVQAGRDAARGNAFDDEPSRFAATLHRLADPGEAGHD